MPINNLDLDQYSDRHPLARSDANDLKSLFPLKPTREILQRQFLDAIQRLQKEDPHQNTAYFNYSEDLARAIHALTHPSNSLEVTFLEKISGSAPSANKLIRVKWYNPKSNEEASEVIAAAITSLAGYTQVSPNWMAGLATRDVGERD